VLENPKINKNTFSEPLILILLHSYKLFFVEIKEGQVRCGEHSDYAILTLLFQDLIGGLEVTNKDIWN
jgi:isopenicillin N synthase-like dioxygenase